MSLRNGPDRSRQTLGRASPVRRPSFPIDPRTFAEASCASPSPALTSMPAAAIAILLALQAYLPTCPILGQGGCRLTSPRRRHFSLISWSTACLPSRDAGSNVLRLLPCPPGHAALAGLLALGPGSQESAPTKARDDAGAPEEDGGGGALIAVCLPRVSRAPWCEDL